MSGKKHELKFIKKLPCGERLHFYECDGKRVYVAICKDDKTRAKLIWNTKLLHSHALLEAIVHENKLKYREKTNNQPSN